MSPIGMFALLAVGLGLFGYVASKRWRLLSQAAAANGRIDRIPERIRNVLRIAIGQNRMTRYAWAGFAHKAIFFGFLVLLLRTLILIARGFVDDPGFGFWIFDSGSPLGNAYSLLKDIYILVVLAGTSFFFYLRLVVKPKRMSQSLEGMAILGIIAVMMFADILYDGASHVMAAQGVNVSVAFNLWEPLGSIVATVAQSWSVGAVTTLQHIGFWTHIGLVFVFLNILPVSKHFHVITAIPNVFFANLNPKGQLVPIEDIEEKVENEETLGIRRIDQMSWKDMLDFYSCTECGRCTDHCPASRTGKLLSPKGIITNLRDFAYSHQSELIGGKSEEQNEGCAVDLVPSVVSEESLWACTTCGACEQECPVTIDHVQRIVDLRRYLVQEKGECPASLQEAFQSMEITGSPYGVDGSERMAWAKDLDVPLRCEVEGEIDVLLWVGCAPATDERAKKIARAVAQLLNIAKVKWAVLGPEEMCTGDVARRAGNEFLFQMMAQTNIEILDGYETKRILTICPHCYNTLKHEYPDFGGKYEVLHHVDFLDELISKGQLKPEHNVGATITYHDSCYLGRYNDIYDSPRTLLKSIPGVVLVEAEGESHDRGMCCGAGGGQMFKEDEPGNERINFARTDQLCNTGADMIATACPFCMRMMTDALNIQEKTDSVQQLDVAEVLLQSVQPLTIGSTS